MKTGSYKAVMQAIEMWDILAQSVAEQGESKHVAGRTKLHNARAQFFPILSALVDYNKDLTNDQKLDRHKDNCRNDPNIMNLVREAASLQPKKLTTQKQKCKQNELWVKTGHRINTIVKQSMSKDFQLKPSEGETSEQWVAEILHDLISEEIDEIDSRSKSDLLPSNRYYRIMSKAGYTNPRNKGRSRPADYTLLDVYHKNSVEQHRRKYQKKITALNQSGQHDENTKLEWNIFFTQMTLALKSVRAFTERQKTIYPYTHHIIADLMRNSASVIRNKYVNKYRTLIRDMIVWVQSTDAMFDSKIIGPGLGTCAPIFEPQDRSTAMFWGYYGVQCPECKNWRVRGTKGGMACCDKCGWRFEPEFILHCTSCWEEYTVTRKKTGYLVSKAKKQPKKANNLWYFDCINCPKSIEMPESGDGLYESSLRTDKRMIMKKSKFKLPANVPLILTFI